MEEAKVALHVQAHTSKNACGAKPTIPCFQYTTKADVGVSYDVYLVVADIPEYQGPGITGLSCGVAYDAAAGQGVDLYSWTFCGSGLEYPHDGDNGPWPTSGSGTRLTWINCQGTNIPPNGYHTIAGSFYVYAYGPDQFQVTENMHLQTGPELAIAGCGGAETQLPLSAAAFVTFSPGAVDTGYNPCKANLENLHCLLPNSTTNFGSVAVGGSKDLAIRFSPSSFGQTGPWVGTVTLNGPSDFTIVLGESYNLPSMDDTATVVVRFTPTAAGQKGCQVGLGSVCEYIGVIGTGVLSALPVVAPSNMSLNLLIGSSSDQSMQVSNQGSVVLNWSSFAEQGTLEDILAALDAHSSEILNLIPNRVNFSYGLTGNSFGDGYKYNFLTTDLSQQNPLGQPLEFLPYSNGIIRESTLLGAQGRYFTRKYPGLFVFAADLADISQFKVTGNQIYTTLNNFSSQLPGLSHGHTAFVHRLWHSNQNSIHRVLISADFPNSSIQYNRQPSTFFEDNLTYSIPGATRVLYFLYMTPPDADLDVPSGTDFANACLDVALPGPQWLLTTSSGQLFPAQSGVGSVHVSAQDLSAGEYFGHVAVRVNSLNHNAVIVPVTLHVLAPVEASYIDVDPNTLNPGSNGHWVNAYVELPSGDIPDEIVLGTVRAQNTVPADPDGFTIGDANQNGIPDVKLRFDREAFIRSFPPQDDVEALIQGEVRNKHYFSGHDAIRVLRPHLHAPNGGERLGAGTFRDVSWASDDLHGVDSIVLYYSPDGGQSWQQQGSVSGGTHFAWHVPADPTANGLLKVEAYGSGAFIGYDITDAPFSVTTETTGIDPTSGFRTMLLPNSPNPFRGSTRIGYTLAARVQVSLDIFDISGRKVRTLVHDALDPGSKQTTWDGRDDTGRHVTPGFYVLRLRTPEVVMSRRLLLMP